ncbi:hypothetical protein O181_022630 [Austropuccinia psidii MF-1]|uniref:Uncharacterized protein n=1 Tax=Austropuccinia psidii MF-1 TaxID=1389203 RepID=A0A9Q3CGY7_9BASI|nr:hypothetical protein [Austropuccinia psidii MF-1]
MKPAKKRHLPFGFRHVKFYYDSLPLFARRGSVRTDYLFSSPHRFSAGANMVNSTKTALIFFTLQSCVHCVTFPRFSSWMSRAGKAGEMAAGGGKAEDGAKTGADLRGAHVDPAHADGGSLDGKIGTTNPRAPMLKEPAAARRTKISIASDKIRQVALATAIKAGS